MGAACQITSLTIVYSTVVDSGADQRKHQSSASLAFVWGIHRGPVNSPHKWPVTRKMFPFDDVIMLTAITQWLSTCQKIERSWYSDTFETQQYFTKLKKCFVHLISQSLIARFRGPTWGPSGADRTPVGPMLAPWILLSGIWIEFWNMSRWMRRNTWAYRDKNFTIKPFLLAGSGSFSKHNDL